MCYRSKTYPSFLNLKEGSTFLTKPLFPQEREDVTALSADFSTSPSLLQGELHILTKPSLLRKEGCNRPTRCSEPLRYKVGGPSKVYAMFCGMGPPCIRLYNSISTSLKYNFIMKGAFFDNSFRSILLNQVVNKFSTLFRYIWTQCYFKLIKYIVL